MGASYCRHGTKFYHDYTECPQCVDDEIRAEREYQEHQLLKQQTEELKRIREILSPKTEGMAVRVSATSTPTHSLSQAGEVAQPDVDEQSPTWKLWLALVEAHRKDENPEKIAFGRGQLAKRVYGRTRYGFVIDWGRVPTEYLGAATGLFVTLTRQPSILWGEISKNQVDHDVKTACIQPDKMHSPLRDTFVPADALSIADGADGRVHVSLTFYPGSGKARFASKHASWDVTEEAAATIYGNLRAGASSPGGMTLGLDAHAYRRPPKVPPSRASKKVRPWWKRLFD